MAISTAIIASKQTLRAHENHKDLLADEAEGSCYGRHSLSQVLRLCSDVGVTIMVQRMTRETTSCKPGRCAQIKLKDTSGQAPVVRTGGTVLRNPGLPLASKG